MYIGRFTANATTTKQIERRSQIIQLYAAGLSGTADDFFASTIEVWNNKGKLIPPMSIGDLCVLNGDEYAIQVGFNSVAAGGTFTVVVDIELADEGGLEKTIYVKCVNALSSIPIDLSAVDPCNCTAVKLRNYNIMNLVSPAQLPKNSICIIPKASITSLQKNNDLMSDSEILTHSNRLLADGVLREVHPVVYDYAKTVPALAENEIYTEIAKSYVMGYGTAAAGKVVIWTGDDDFMLYPNTSCSVVYCEKQLTKIAEQVQSALIVAGQANNVDSNEFAAAVAAVGREAERQGLSTDQTQIIANRVVPNLPSVKISQLAKVVNFNLASETSKQTGVSKIVGA